MKIAASFDDELNDVRFHELVAEDGRILFEFFAIINIRLIKNLWGACFD